MGGSYVSPSEERPVFLVSYCGVRTGGVPASCEVDSALGTLVMRSLPRWVEEGTIDAYTVLRRGGGQGVSKRSGPGIDGLVYRGGPPSVPGGSGSGSGGRQAGLEETFIQAWKEALMLLLTS